MERALNILVIGAGAIGCLVGGKLAQSGQTVTLVGRSRLSTAIQHRGLILRTSAGEAVVRNLQVVERVTAAFSPSIASISTQIPPYDLAILTVKSYDTATALNELTAALATHQLAPPTILSLQNGVGNEETIAAAVGAKRVIAGSITTPVSVPEPGIIQIEKPHHVVGISAWQGDTAPAAALLTLLSKAGFDTRLYPNAASMKWTKLLMNMVGNASSAILDESPAQLFSDPALVDMEIAAWREALAVMRGLGVAPVNFGSYPFRWLAPLIRFAPNGLLRPFLRWRVGGARGNKLPSLHIDLHSNKGKSEVDWLNGAVVQAGQQVGIATPVNAWLTETLTALVHDPAARADWRGQHKRLVSVQSLYNS
jgi:2-dehydropantoate 2-reductase